MLCAQASQINPSSSSRESIEIGNGKGMTVPAWSLPLSCLLDHNRPAWHTHDSPFNPRPATRAAGEVKIHSSAQGRGSACGSPPFFLFAARPSSSLSHTHKGCCDPHCQACQASCAVVLGPRCSRTAAIFASSGSCPNALAVAWGRRRGCLLAGFWAAVGVDRHQGRDGVNDEKENPVGGQIGRFWTNYHGRLPAPRSRGACPLAVVRQTFEGREALDAPVDCLTRCTPRPLKRTTGHPPPLQSRWYVPPRVPWIER